MLEVLLQFVLVCHYLVTISKALIRLPHELREEPVSPRMLAPLPRDLKIRDGMRECGGILTLHWP